VAVLAFLTSIGVLMATAPAALRQQSGTDGLGSQQQDYPLSCRGGGQLVFVPIKPPTDGDQAVTFEVPFATSAHSRTVSTGEGLIESSGGRLQLRESRVSAGAVYS
jgi:hypothetical protein